MSPYVRRVRQLSGPELGLWFVVGLVLTTCTVLLNHHWVRWPILNAFEILLAVLVFTYCATMARTAHMTAVSLGCALIATGVGQFCALAAAIGFGSLWLRQRKTRSIRLLAGGTLWFGLLEVSVASTHIVNIAIAATCAACVVILGIRRSPRKIKRAARLAGLGVGAACLAWIGFAAWVGMRARPLLERGADDARLGVAAAKHNERETAISHLNAAEASFAKGAAHLDNLAFRSLQIIPFAGENAHAAIALAKSGERLSELAARTASEVDYDRLKSSEARINLPLVHDLERTVGIVDEAVGSTRTTINSLDSALLFPPVRTQVANINLELAKFAAQIDPAHEALRHLPNLLGEQQQRRYLVLLGNPAELRDIGGHLGNWASLTVTNGMLELERVGVPGDLADSSGDGLAADWADLPPSLVEMQPGRFPQNWGSHADFPSVAVLAKRHFEATTKLAVQGVIYADPQALSALLTMTGPVRIPNTDFTVDSTNVTRFLTLDQFSAFATDPEANAVVTELVRVAFQRFTQLSFPGPEQFSSTFAEARDGGHIQVMSFIPEEDRFLRSIGLVNSHDAPGDMLSIVNRNANPSKIDTFLQRSSSYEAKVDENGHLNATVTIELTNTAPPNGYSTNVIGGIHNLPLGTNVTDLAILSHWELTEIQVDGVPVSGSSLDEKTWWRHSARLELAPGQRRVIRFVLAGEYGTEPYAIRADQQPMVNESRLTIDVSQERPKVGILGQRGVVDRTEGSTSAHRLDLQINPPG